MAAAVGVPNLPVFALQLLGEQILGVLTMLLMVVRFLALGEALHHPGNFLSGLHATLAWLWGFYLTIAGMA